MFIKSKPGKYGIKLWFAADARIFMPATSESGRVREKKQGLRVVTDMVCQMYRTRTRVTTDNLCTSCELAKFFLSKNMTVVGTLRKNTPEIPALFLSGKQRNVHSSIFGFTNDLTLVSYVPARNKTVILLSSQHHHDTSMGEEKDHKPEISCMIMPLKVVLMSWTSLRGNTLVQD